MMKCREFIFLLTSGQLQQAGFAVRTDARVHRLLCKRCNTFFRNNQQLDQWLTDSRQELSNLSVIDAQQDPRDQD